MHHKTSFLLLPILGILLLGACTGKEQQAAETGQAAPSAGHTAPEDILYMATSQVTLTGVSWSPVPSGGERNEQVLFGEWTLHPEHRAMAVVLAAGRVKKLHYQMNAQVAKGAVLAELESPEFLQLQRRFLEARSRYGFLKQEYQRVRSLSEQDATSRRNLEQVQSEAEAARSEMAGLAAELKLYGVDTASLSADALRATYAITAPIAGRTTSSLVSTGQWLDTGAPLCDLAQFEQMHADLFVYPDLASSVSPGDAVYILSSGGERIPAKVLHIDRMLDHEKKAIRVHCLPVLPKGIALPVEGSYAKGILPAPGGAAGLYLPLSAVRKENGGEFIFVHLPDKSTPDRTAFRKVAVQTTQTTGEGVYITPSTPLEAGAEIVLQGAYYIDAQSKVQEFSEE